MVQLLQPYVSTGKTMALAISIFAISVISLYFNILSRFLIVFLLEFLFIHSYDDHSHDFLKISFHFSVYFTFDWLFLLT